MKDKKFTLITGASSGIGLELAKIAARKGQNLILVARSKEKLSNIAKNLHELDKVSVIVISMDLEKPDSPRKLFDYITKKELNIENLINNAGFGTYGDFTKLDLEVEENMIQLNVTTLVELCHLFLKSIEKNKGRILNVASTAAFQPIPYMATYAATKAFVFSFSEALNLELKKSGVSVTALCPGPTKTHFENRAHMQKTGLFSGSNVMSPQEVAEIGFRAMMKRKSSVVAGATNKVGVLAAKLVPASTSASLAKRIMKK